MPVRCLFRGIPLPYNVESARRRQVRVDVSGLLGLGCFLAVHLQGTKKDKEVRFYERLGTCILVGPTLVVCSRLRDPLRILSRESNRRRVGSSDGEEHKPFRGRPPGFLCLPFFHQTWIVRLLTVCVLARSIAEAPPTVSNTLIFLFYFFFIFTRFNTRYGPMRDSI